jgi:hypothetical protein
MAAVALIAPPQARSLVATVVVGIFMVRHR